MRRGNRSGADREVEESSSGPGPLKSRPAYRTAVAVATGLRLLSDKRGVVRMNVREG